jgi:hypothetical protein
MYPMRRIQRLQDTLSAVSLRDAAALLGLGGESAVAELQSSLREMVRAPAALGNASSHSAGAPPLA